MSKTSIFLLVIFILSLIALLSINTMYSSNPVLKSFPAIFPTQAVVPSENTLALTPSELTAPPGKSTSVQVIIDSKGEQPSLIQMELAYDPGAISAVKVTPGTFFSQPQVLLNNVNARNGRVSYAIAPSPNQHEPTNSNIAATIIITPRAGALQRVTTLYFLPKTVVRTKNSENTLKIAYGTKITVGAIAAPASPAAQITN